MFAIVNGAPVDVHAVEPQRRHRVEHRIEAGAPVGKARQHRLHAVEGVEHGGERGVRLQWGDRQRQHRRRDRNAFPRMRLLNEADHPHPVRRRGHLFGGQPLAARDGHERDLGCFGLERSYEGAERLIAFEGRVVNGQLHCIFERKHASDRGADAFTDAARCDESWPHAPMHPQPRQRVIEREKRRAPERLADRRRSVRVGSAQQLDDVGSVRQRGRALIHRATECRLLPVQVTATSGRHRVRFGSTNATTASVDPRLPVTTRRDARSRSAPTASSRSRQTSARRCANRRRPV